MTKADITLDTIIYQHPDVVSADMEDSIMLLSMQHSAYVDLKETGSHIWRLIEQPKSVSAICDGLSDIFDVEREKCEASTLKYLENMVAKNLIAIAASDTSGSS